MATKYKLSYTASDIDKRLGRIDILEEKIEQISNQDQTGGTGGTDNPSGSGATAEQIEQIEKNTNDIVSLTEQLEGIENQIIDIDTGNNDNVFNGSVDEIKGYLSELAESGTMTARFNGTYTVSSKIQIPANMTIIGGTFVSDSTYEDALFSAQGDNVRLINVTLKAPALDKAPAIYPENNDTTAKASNVLGLFSDGYNNIAMIDCLCDKIIPAKINNGSGMISGCTVTDTPMFIWATNTNMHVSNNDVYICNTGLDYYYHVYYLNQNSELYANNNRIYCDTDVPFFDIYHLMTAGNNGAYRTLGIIDGDVVTGNFQHIIDCHYTDLVLKNCYIHNTNTEEWTEFSNQAHSSFSYHGCKLIYDNASSQVFDTSMTSPVGYYQCDIQRTKSMSRRCTFKGCNIKQTLTSESILSNLSDIYDCEFHVYGTATGIAITESGNFNFNMIGNVFKFEEVNTNNYMLRCATSVGCICNNVITGAKTTNLWYNNAEIGTCVNNIVITKATT